MKRIIKQLFSSTVILLILTAILASAFNTASNSKVPVTREEITPAIDSSKWVFTANEAMPQYGNAKPLTAEYSVVYKNNKLTVYLPYYGRAFDGADVFSGKNPLDFTSVKFTLDKQPAKKGGWNITIKPKDNNDVVSMNFTFYDNGNARLEVSMSNRSPISFTGSVEPSKG